ncbi:MAG: GNAT family N-acetyltransferase [Clostridia bacterium]|nr:GNAT family N-acetyltransferase [Clostridia bacterium]
MAQASEKLFGEQPDDATVHVKHFSEMTAREVYDLLELRVAVFVVEQQCAYQEVDGLDLDAIHVWLSRHGQVVACARVMKPGVESECVSIGRVVSRARGLGDGERVLREAVRVAEERLGADSIYLEAQVYARGFYEKQGFGAVGEEFLLDGIRHIRMIRTGRGEIQRCPSVHGL